ncbi:uncharacterized protein [Periplaneta americana]|uniref:uncharacterized protein isoform X7 n=1 Tax=Periplaneta americana TaxID=6978 RepID=UPI0037E715D7
MDDGDTEKDCRTQDNTSVPKSFTCNRCDESFGDRQQLRDHMITHIALMEMSETESASEPLALENEDIIKKESKIDPLALEDVNSVLVDSIKAEPTNDPLSLKNGEDTDAKPLPQVGTFLQVNVNNIKIEPSDVNCDGVPDVSYEGNEDPVSYPVMKFETVEESWNVGAGKKEPISITTEEDDGLTQTTHGYD